MVNAAKYSGGAGVSVYAEVSRRRGHRSSCGTAAGVSTSTPCPRTGWAAESIIGRMERNGGKAEVRTAPGEGTEVDWRCGDEAT